MENKDKKFTDKVSKWYKKMSVGTKLALSTVLVSSVVFGAYVGSMSYYTKNLATDNALEELTHTTDSVMMLIATFDNNISYQANRFNDLLAKNFTGSYSIDTTNTVQVKDSTTPTLKNGETLLNNNNEVLDTFKTQTGLTSTIFVKSGNEFIRVATTLTNDKNERMVGEKMDHGHPGYASLSEGKPYAGVADINGKFYGTSYKPLKNDKGDLVGVMYVGIDITAEMAKLKENIKSIKIGDTGYYYILGNNQHSKQYGELLLHPVKEGTNLLQAKDADGNFFIQEMLKKKNGIISYPWINKERNETVSKPKTVVYRTYENWNWTIGGGTYNHEITGEIDKVYNIFAGILVLVMVALAGGLYIVIRRSIVYPLKDVQVAAQSLAKGDLTVHLSTKRQDEIGVLFHAMNDIANGLEQVVSNVQVSAKNIKVASQEIAAGNHDLSSRTEQQAASLEETASSMEELTSTIKNNADQARQVSHIVVQTSQKAQQGGVAMHDLVNNMEAIKHSSQKIVDIIAVIDGIAFQTNILALNAAVEAAHAGEQGRGFAVVASEVRNLAQRSANAAKEIKQLIDDSMEKVQTGNNMVNSTSSTIAEIVESVKNVEGIMKEIANANHEQTLGIEQINSAIIQMDDVTQQNAALVEEAAAAATSMLEQAKQMEDSVLVFKLKK